MTRMRILCGTIAVAILAVFSLAATANARTAFTAEFRDGLSEWKRDAQGVVLSVENFSGEDALVVRRDPNFAKKGTEWSMIGKSFPVTPGNRLAVTVRARSSFKDLRFCRGYNGNYLTGIYWYDRDGRRMRLPHGFGYELKADGWCWTVSSAVVPEGAANARLSIGMDKPDFTSNDWFAVSSARVDEWRPDDSGSTTALRDDGAVLVDGKPFFPIGIYAILPCERNGNSIDTALRDLKAAGFNMVHRTRPTPEDENEEFLSLADKHGLKVMAMPMPKYESDIVGDSLVAKQMRHPSVLAWYVADDTASHAGPEEVAWRTKVCKAYDPARLTLQADFLLIGWANNRYERYVNSTDIFLPEVYPVSVNTVYPDGGEVAEVVRDMKATRAAIVAAGSPVKSVWPIIQHFEGWGAWKRFPTFAELRAMCWESIIHGGNGIVWYVYHAKNGKGRGVVSSDEHWREITAMSSEISALSGDLLTRTAEEQPEVDVLSGPDKDCFGHPSVSVLLKTGESPLLATVNATTNKVTAALRIKGFRKADLVGGGAALDASDGIRDEWGPYGVRLYRLSR